MQTLPTIVPGPLGANVNTPATLSAKPDSTYGALVTSGAANSGFAEQLVSIVSPAGARVDVGVQGEPEKEQEAIPTALPSLLPQAQVVTPQPVEPDEPAIGQPASRPAVALLHGAIQSDAVVNQQTSATLDVVAHAQGQPEIAPSPVGVSTPAGGRPAEPHPLVMSMPVADPGKGTAVSPADQVATRPQPAVGQPVASAGATQTGRTYPTTDAVAVESLLGHKEPQTARSGEVATGAQGAQTQSDQAMRIPFERFAMQADDGPAADGPASFVMADRLPPHTVAGSESVQRHVNVAPMPAVDPVQTPTGVPAAQTLELVSISGDDRQRHIVVDAPDAGRIEIDIVRDGGRLRVALHCARADVAEGLQRHQQSLMSELQQTGTFGSVQVDVGTSSDSSGQSSRQPFDPGDQIHTTPSEQASPVALSAALHQILEQWTGGER